MNTPCILCGQPTDMPDATHCNRCWELARRIQADPELSAKILLTIGRPVTQCSICGGRVFWNDRKATEDEIEAAVAAEIVTRKD